MSEEKLLVGEVGRYEGARIHEGLLGSASPPKSSRPSLLMVALAGMATLLPGDVIHDEAPLTKAAKSNGTADEQIAAAKAKREHKAAKRGRHGS